MAQGASQTEPHSTSFVSPVMTANKIFNEPGKVSARDGVVHLDGPDSVDLRLTAEAAEEISDRLLEGALAARGQMYFADKRKRRDP